MAHSFIALDKAVDVTGDGSKVRYCKEQYCIGTWNVRSMNQGKLEVVKQEMRFDPWVGKIHGEGNGNPLQYYCLENPMDRGAWKAAVHEVVEGRTRLSNFTFTFHFHALEKEIATHASILAWEIPMDREFWWATAHGHLS